MTLPRDPTLIFGGRRPDGSWSSKRRGHVGDSSEGASSFWKNATQSLRLPVMRSLRAVLGITIALYILNQKHMLPKPLSAVVSKVLFYPSLPITVGRRIGRWHTVVDDTVIMGGAPIGFARIPEYLKEQYGVRSVINLCEEYRGPEKSYKRLGMEQLWLPTTDHFEVSIDNLWRAVDFIHTCKKHGERVYVHCRAGHGRSAAVVFAWLLYQDPTVDRKALNAELCSLRDVRKTLWRQPILVKFHSSLIQREDDLHRDAE